MTIRPYVARQMSRKRPMGRRGLILLVLLPLFFIIFWLYIAKKQGVRVMWCWYDLWVGGYVDVDGRTLYICLLPTMVLVIPWKDG